MRRLWTFGVILLIGLNSIVFVKCQDEDDEAEAESYNESDARFSSIQQDMYGDDVDMEIFHRVEDDEPESEIKNNDKREVSAKSLETSDQKPAESLLSMSIDPLSDGANGDPDIKAVLADAEAQEEMLPGSNRVPHQLNLAVGSASNYQNAPTQQFQYTQTQGQAAPPTPLSTISEEHRKAIAQLALQQQQTVAQQANEQRDAEQKRLEQDALYQQQYLQQQEQYLAQQPQFQQQQQQAVAPQFQQQQQTIPPQFQQQQPGAVAPQFQQQQQPTVQQPQLQQQLYNPSGQPPLAQPAPTVQQFTQFATPSQSPQLAQYQQSSDPNTASQYPQLIQQQNPTISSQFQNQGITNPTSQGISQPHFQQQTYQGSPTVVPSLQFQPQNFQNPSQLPPVQLPQQIVPGPTQVPSQLFAGPSQVPQLQQQLQQLIQQQTQLPPAQQQYQQTFQSPTQASGVPLLQPQVYPSPTPSTIPLQQQQIYATPSPQLQQQIYQNPSQAPPAQQQLNQVYQNLNQQPSLQPYQQNTLQYPSPTTSQPPQPQQLIYQNPSVAPQQVQIQQHQQIPQQVQVQQQQQIPQQVHLQHQQQAAVPTQASISHAQFPTQFTQQQEQAAPQQYQQHVGTPQSTAQYHVQVSPPTNQPTASQNVFGQQSGFSPENTLALGSEQSSVASSAHSSQQNPSTIIESSNQQQSNEAVQQQSNEYHQHQQQNYQHQPHSRNPSKSVKSPPPQNIQQILSQQNYESEASDESGFSKSNHDEHTQLQQNSEEQYQQPELENANQQFQEQSSSEPYVEVTTSKYPTTHDIQQEYEKAIKNSHQPISVQEASQELMNYAQTIEERAAQILANFRKQVLGGRSKETTTTTTTVPTTTFYDYPQELPPTSSGPEYIHQLDEAININAHHFEETTVQPAVQQPSIHEYPEQHQQIQQEQVPTQPAQSVPSASPTFEHPITVPTLPTIEKEKLNQALQQPHSTLQSQLQVTPTTAENEIIQEGSASIQKEVVHGQYHQNSLDYQPSQIGNGFPFQQQQQAQFGLINPTSQVAPAQQQQNQAIMQQVIETQAIQQNSLQQLWQLYQQQQKLLQQQQQQQQQQEKQRQDQITQGRVSPPVSQVQPRPIPPAQQNPYLQQQIPSGYVQSSSHVTFPGDIRFPLQQQPAPSVLQSPEGGTLYYQQFIGPAPSDIVQRPPSSPPIPDTSAFSHVQENAHYTIYKVKEDASPLNAYRTLTGSLPGQSQPQRIESSQPIVQTNYNQQILAQEQARATYNNYQRQQQQQQQFVAPPEPIPTPVPGQELVPLEEVGRHEEAHAFLQLPAHEQQQPGFGLESLLSPGPTQPPHTTIQMVSSPQQQSQVFNTNPTYQPQPQQAQTQQKSPPKSQPAPPTEFYQVQSQSYIMPEEPPTIIHYNAPPSFQIQSHQYEDIPTFLGESPSITIPYPTSNQQQIQANPSQLSPQYTQYQPRTAGGGQKPGTKINYPKPIITSITKPGKRLRNKHREQYSTIADMEYPRESLLPVDEASFAAHQAQMLGGPAFRDEGYNTNAKYEHHESSRGTNPSSVAESFGLSLKPLLRLGKLSAKAFKQGFTEKMQKLNEGQNRRKSQTSPNGSEEQETSASSLASTTIPIRIRKNNGRLRLNRKQQQQEADSLLEQVKQVFAPRVGDLEIKEISIGKESRIPKAVVTDLLKAATTGDDNVELVESS